MNGYNNTTGNRHNGSRVLALWNVVARNPYRIIIVTFLASVIPIVFYHITALTISFFWMLVAFALSPVSAFANIRSAEHKYTGLQNFIRVVLAITCSVYAFVVYIQMLINFDSFEVYEGLIKDCAFGANLCGMPLFITLTWLAFMSKKSIKKGTPVMIALGIIGAILTICVLIHESSRVWSILVVLLFVLVVGAVKDGMSK